MFKGKPSVKVINPPLANDAVTTDKIAEKAVTEDKLSDEALAWHITANQGLSHPARAIWNECAGDGLVFGTNNKSTYNLENFVMRDQSAVTTAYALFAPSLTVALVDSAPAGSTSYTVNASLYAPGLDLDYLLGIPFGWEKEAGAKLPTSVALDANNKVVLTFAESLNPSQATTTLLACTKLNSTIYGGLFTGAGLSLKGQASVVNGLYIKNEGGHSLVTGRYINNTGGRSAIVGERIQNTGNRAFLFGQSLKNEKNEVMLVGVGHTVGAECQSGLAAFGTYSDIGTDTVFVVGNGTDNDNRSNAFEIKGTGDVLVGADPTEDNGVATKHYVDNKALYRHSLYLPDYNVRFDLINNTSTEYTSAPGLPDFDDIMASGAYHSDPVDATVIVNGVKKTSTTFYISGVRIDTFVALGSERTLSTSIRVWDTVTVI